MPTADDRLWSLIKSKSKFWKSKEAKNPENLFRDTLGMELQAVNEEKEALEAAK